MFYFNLIVYALAALGVLVVWALIDDVINRIKGIMVQRRLAKMKRENPEYFEIMDYLASKPGWAEKDPIERLHAYDAEKDRRDMMKNREWWENHMGREELEKYLKETK